MIKKEIFINYIKENEDREKYDRYMQRFQYKISAEFDSEHGSIKHKEFIEDGNSDVQLKNMLIYASSNYESSEVTIVIWSIFDLNIWDFFVINSSYKVISLLEDEKVIEAYSGMVANFIEQETA